MFFIFSKVLAFLLNPLIWILGLIVTALIVKNTKKKKKILIITVLLTYLLSNSFIISEFYRVWEIQPVHILELDEYYDVGVVLGGGMATYDKRFDRFALRVNTDRMMQAVYLYKEKRLGKILISGGYGTLFLRHKSEAVIVRDFLINVLEIPSNDILVDSVSDNTYQNAVESTKLINNNFKNPNVLLITSAFHMRRANLCFKKQGIKPDLYPTDLIAGPRRFQFDHLFIPQLHNLIKWHLLTHEFIGIISYKLMGYI